MELIDLEPGLGLNRNLLLGLGIDSDLEPDIGLNRDLVPGLGLDRDLESLHLIGI